MSYEDLIRDGLHIKIDMREIMSEIINEYNLKPYKYICVIDNYLKIQSVIKSVEKNFSVDFIKWKDNVEGYNIVAGDYITKDFGIIVKYYPFLDDRYLAVLFGNNLSDLLDLNENIDLYKTGIYMFSDLNGLALHELKIGDEYDPVIDKEMEVQLQNDIDNFFSNKEFYKENNLTYRRGLLFYGTYGVGKSSFIKHILKKQQDCYSIIVDCGKNFNAEFATFIDVVCKDNKKIIIFEDIDKIPDYNKTTLFNFLDGVGVLENTLIIATTNHIEELDGALINRPSRFDRLYYFDLPNNIMRKKIIELYFKKIDFDIDKAVKETEGFSGAFLKELFVLTNIQKCDIFEGIKNIKKQFALIKEYDLNQKENYFG